MTHDFHAAADGQLGGIMKVFREWRSSGDTEWLRRLWPRVKASLDYCIDTWDPDRKGLLEEPHHNTYDIEFWGPDGMCTSFYLGALRAAVQMARRWAITSPLTPGCSTRASASPKANFSTRILHPEDPVEEPSRQKPAGNQEHGRQLFAPRPGRCLKREGPKYQYGNGCLADGVLGHGWPWFAAWARCSTARRSPAT